jgi:hypothetical protein
MIRICIPTFNRWDRLQVQLAQLLSAQRLGGRFSVDLFDNASTDGTPEQFRLLGLPAEFVLHVHDRNVGFEGNVRRILQHIGQQGGADDHLWILSDDDFIFPAALVQLTRWLETQTPALPVLLSFLMFDGGSLRRRPPALYPAGLQSAADLFNIVNQTTLISCWLYPARFLRPSALSAFDPWLGNSFLQMVLLAVVLRQASAFAIFERPLGFEFVNLQIRFRLKETFAVDRPKALAEAVHLLGGDPALIDAAMSGIAVNFARRALVWECSGDRQSAAQAMDAMPELARHGWLPRQARAYLFLRRCFLLLKRCGVAGPLLRRGAAVEQRARLTQDLLKGLLSEGGARHCDLPPASVGPTLNHHD